MPKTKRKPTYLMHKPSGQARCRIDGRDVYLGRYGTAESRDRYDELVREWMLRNGNVDHVTLTVDELAVRFMDHATEYYRRADGTPTPEVVSLSHAISPLIKLFGTGRVREFGPLKLKAVRASLIEAGNCRTNINRMVERIRRMFGWGVENEIVPADLLLALRAVPGLRAGRTKARESDPVTAVDDATVNPTVEHLPPVLADMVRLQLLTGARPGEICSLRPCDVDRSGDVWTYRPPQHKTLHRGKERRIHIGPQGQRILGPYLLRPADAFCFSPRDSERKRNSKRKENRQSPMTPSQTAREPKGRKLADRYVKDAYTRAVKRAATKAGVKTWTPNQLRHAAATMLRERFGIEAAQVTLGHSDPKTTLIYAENQFSKAAEIARQIG